MWNYKSIRFEVNNSVATITLNRPDAANSINMEIAQELMKAAICCDEDSSIRAVILTAEGRMFCTGGDLKSLTTFGDQISSAMKELTVYLHAAMSRFARMDAPLIVAVNGAAAGAGFSLAVSGDLVLAAESSKFTMAYTAAGLSPDGSSSYYLPRLIGLRRTQELMISNRLLSAQEALDWGLVTRVVADDQLLSEARILADQLAQGPTRAYGTVKKLLLTSFDTSLESQMELEARGIAEMTTTADGLEGITAFTEKRKPEFSGC